MTVFYIHYSLHFGEILCLKEEGEVAGVCKMQDVCVLARRGVWGGNSGSDFTVTRISSFKPSLFFPTF